MGLPKQKTGENSKETLYYLENNPDTLRLNFCEQTPVAKLLFKITPQEHIGITKISYGLGSTDLSVNGYISLVISKVENPNVWSVSQDNSQILFDKMVGASSFDNGDILFLEPIVLQQNEPIYIYLFSNMPASAQAIGKLVFYYKTLHL